MKTEYELDGIPTDNNSGLSGYIAEARRYPILTRENEKEIAIKALAGDKKAYHLLANSNLLLVVKIAHEYKPIFNNLNDLVQEGNVGLLKAITKYDPDKGYRFSTYSGWWIRSLILRYIFNNSHMIKPGTTNDEKRLFYNLRKEQRRLEDLGIDADAATVANNLEVDESCVVEMDGRLRSDVYLDAPAAPDTDPRSLIGSFLVEAKRPDAIIEEKEFKMAFHDKLEAFGKKLKNKKQKEVFLRRMVAEDPETLQSIADDMGKSRERVRQIESIVLGKLKKQVRALA